LRKNAPYKSTYTLLYFTKFRGLTVSVGHVHELCKLQKLPNRSQCRTKGSWCGLQCTTGMDSFGVVRSIEKHWESMLRRFT